jgi:hypothetical protein
VVTVAGDDVAWSEVEEDAVDAPELVELDLDVVEVDLALVVFADIAGSLPCAIWTASAPVRASAAATAIAVIFAVSAVMAGTMARPPQRKLGAG